MIFKNISLLFFLIYASFTFSDGWLIKKSMPTARCQTVGILLNNKVYIIAGRSNADTPLKVVEEYDPISDSWQRKAHLNEGRRIPAGCVYNNKIYEFGGNGENKDLDTVEVYDPDSDSWKYANTKLPTARFDMIAQEINGIIYVIGGVTSSGTKLSVNEAFNPSTETWQIKASLPSPTRGMGSCVYNNKIYIFGGYNNRGSSDKVFVYDPSTDYWSEKKPMPTPRRYLSCALLNDKVYCMGGWNNKSLKLNEMYDPQNDLWSTKSSLSFAKAWISLVPFQNSIYTFGGWTGNIGLDKNEKYNPNEDFSNLLFFNSNKYSLNNENANKIKDFLKNITNIHYTKIIVKGYTDNTSTEDFNKRLSWLRANSVAQYLILHGISPEKIEINGRSIQNPMGDNNTEKGRALNRRVEINLKTGK